MDEEQTLDTGTEQTGDSGAMGNDPVDPASSFDGAQAQTDGEAAVEPQAEKPQEESFVDPATLPPELKAHWSRMHQAYTKTREELKRGRQALEVINRFQADPQFAEQALQQRAMQLGYQLVRPGQNGQQNGGYAGQNGNGGQVPHEYVQIAEQTLPPELQWMAPALAQSSAAIAKQIAEQMVSPIVATQKQSQLANLHQEYSKLESELTEKHPDWVTHESTMDEIRDWWQSGSLTHPKFGNKLEWLYKMATEQQSSVTEAAKRMRQAAKNRSSVGQTPSYTAPNVSERIRQAKSDEEAWEIAGKHALEEARRRAR